MPKILLIFEGENFLNLARKKLLEEKKNTVFVNWRNETVLGGARGWNNFRVNWTFRPIRKYSESRRLI